MGADAHLIGLKPLLHRAWLLVPRWAGRPRLTQFRRVATRYEKLDVSYLAMVTVAAILIC